MIQICHFYLKNDKNILDNKIFDEGNSNINNIDEGKIKLFTKAEIVLLSKEKRPFGLKIYLY